MCWVFEVIFLSPTQNLEGTNASESMVTFGIFARDILRHGFLFAEHWCVNRFFNRILVLNKIFSLTLQRVASETWAVQYILMVRIFQPFHLTFNYFLVNRWIQFLANWIRFRRSVHDHSCLDHCCGLLICQTLSGRTGKISKNTKTTNLIHWLYESLSGSSFSVKRIRNSQNRVKPNHPLFSQSNIFPFYRRYDSSVGFWGPGLHHGTVQ